MGIDLAKAALDAGHRVVATARDAANVTAALGEHNNLLALSLDITDPAASAAAVEAAVERFGSIDISSTTPATSTPATSRRSATPSSALRWKPTSSAR